MPLDRILSDTGIKRKAIAVVKTKCRFCDRIFMDKYFKGERIHKVRCDYCGLINAEVDIDDYMKTLYQGFRYDMGTYGSLGYLPKGTHFKKMVKEAFGFKTDEEVEMKLKEYETGVKMMNRQRRIEEERKKRRTKITIKHKGEESYQLGKKKEKKQMPP